MSPREGVAEGECHGGGFVHEVFISGIAVVPGTVSHIAIGYVLRFKTESRREVVFPGLYGKVVGDRPYFLVDAVVPGVLLVSGVHESPVGSGFVGFHDVDGGEVAFAFPLVAVVERETDESWLLIFFFNWLFNSAVRECTLFRFFQVELRKVIE